MSDVTEAFEESAAEPQTDEYVEFIGWPPYGTEFTSLHTISADHMREVHNIELGTEEAVWRKGSNGRFLVPTSSLSREAVAYLKTDAAFQVVNL